MCTIIEVFEGKDAEFIKNLFKTVDKDGPKGLLLGFIDKNKEKGAHDCPHLFSWGSEYYCDNQEHLKQFLQEIKEPDKCDKSLL